MKTAEIRKLFLDYFKNQQHEIVPSSSLVPANDPTLLFTNAGMVQFKETFLGAEKRSYTRASTVQRCVRAGGKHNDLDNVGYTARHHTFFEMLGNFSFGDYFKREAINFAWKFLTEELKLPQEKLWVTVYEDDDEAADIWLKDMKVDPKRFSRCGAADNFWSMGDTGPCGPCTEIFYDHGADIPGGPPGSEDADADRYIEIWNLVFMQYDRSAAGELSPLPKPSVDTGMGLERIAAVMQGVHNNYDIDLFQTLINAIAQLGNIQDLTQASLKVVADHIRSTVFLISDGIIPSNEGRGYVLRRIMRRAIRHGHKLGFDTPFLHCLVGAVISEMGEAYPEIAKRQKDIENIIFKEEEQFAKTLELGLRLLEQELAELSGKTIPGELVFKLYDTYGFPADLTADIARERHLEIDHDGFQASMAKQRAMSQQAGGFQADYERAMHIKDQSEFTGYENLMNDTAITSIWCGEDSLACATSGDEVAIILAATPFYAESGGQVGDKGCLQHGNASFEVLDTQKVGQAILHVGVVRQGEFHVGESVSANVDVTRRSTIMLNHSATHLLHAALRHELGDHVIQKGSLVAADRLRFDFSHFTAVTPEQLNAIEILVNQQIRADLAVDTNVMSPKEAQQAGAMALFGEKYGDKVRVLSMGEFSKELCGGTHVKRTGEIGFFKIIMETGIAAGVRRIEAITGDAAITWAQQTSDQLQEIAERLKSNPEAISNKLSQLLKRNRELEKQVTALQSKLAGSSSVDLASQAVEVAGAKVLAAKLDNIDSKALRDTLDKLRDRLQPAVVVLASAQDEKLQVVAGVSKALIGKVPNAAEYVKALCGRGGGRPDMAQGGGELPDDLDQRLQQIVKMVEDAVSTTL